MSPEQSPKKQPDCESQFELSITEVCYSFGISEQMIEEMVNEGILQQRLSSSSITFRSKELQKIHKVLRLRQDLGVNMAGAALALELMERIERLESMFSKHPFY